ncbi:putative Leucine--tRNA ligase [Blattamonas nauphoetae]|uniref:Leucine--tRNA ligase n=1 Tax=Blattamonas nauphoetae TaxID=2049346 RepID=A0ABQ9XZM8_9EUKA|nr:putative Leucine--tRNA ligase [Blattamonas nauphoetae]
MTSRQFQILQDIEQFSQNKWKDEHTFDVSPDPYEERPKKTITTPMPYTDSLMSLNRGFALTVTDIYANYASMKGSNVLLSLNFQFSGTRIKSRSNQLKKEIDGIVSTFPERLIVSGRDSEFLTKPPVEKSDINITGLLMKCGVKEENVKDFVDESAWMHYFAKCGKRDAMKLGMRIDWRRSLIASRMNPYFVSFVNWQMTKLQEKGHAKKARTPMIWSEKLGQPCLDHDRLEGGPAIPIEYMLVKHSLIALPDIFHFYPTLHARRLESVEKNSKLYEFLASRPSSFAELEARRNQIYCLSTTARPESISTTIAVFVHPDSHLGGYLMGNGEIYICSARAARNLFYQHCEDLEAIGANWEDMCIFSVAAQHLIGLPVEQNILVDSTPLQVPVQTALPEPSKQFSKQQCFIIPGRFINDKHGSGFLEARPGDNVDQYVAFKKMLRQNEQPKTEYTQDFIWETPEHYFGSVKIDHPDLDDPKQKKLLFEIQIPKEKAQKGHQEHSSMDTLTHPLVFVPPRSTTNPPSNASTPSNTSEMFSDSEVSMVSSTPPTAYSPSHIIPHSIQATTFSGKPIKSPAFSIISGTSLTPVVPHVDQCIYLSSPNVVELLAKDPEHPTSEEVKNAVEWMNRISYNYGTIANGRFKGLGVKEARFAAKEFLVENHAALEYYEPSMLTISTVGDECVVKMGEEWVLTYSDEEWIDQAQIFMQQLDLGGSDSLRLYLQSAIQNIKDRPFTHRYGMGVPLCLDPLNPCFIEPLTDSTVYTALYSITHFFNEGIKTADPANPVYIIDPDLLTPEVWEYILCDGPMPGELASIPLSVWQRKQRERKEKEAAQIFDNAARPRIEPELPPLSPSTSPSQQKMVDVKGIPIEVLTLLKQEYDYWYPVDLRVIGIHLRRNHLVYSLFMHADLLPLSKFPRKVLVLPEMTVEGRDPHMTSYFFTPFTNTIDEVTADGMRIAMVKPRRRSKKKEDLDFSRQVAAEANSILLKELVFFEQLCCVNNFDFFDVDEVKSEIHGEWILDYSETKPKSGNRTPDPHSEASSPSPTPLPIIPKSLKSAAQTTAKPLDPNDYAIHTIHSMNLLKHNDIQHTVPENFVSQVETILKQTNHLSLVLHGNSTSILPEHVLDMRKRVRSRVRPKAARTFQLVANSHPFSSPSNVTVSSPVLAATNSFTLPDLIPDVVPDAIRPQNSSSSLMGDSSPVTPLAERSLQPLLSHQNEECVPLSVKLPTPSTSNEIEQTKPFERQTSYPLFYKGETPSPIVDTFSSFPSLHQNVGSTTKRASSTLHQMPSSLGVNEPHTGMSTESNSSVFTGSDDDESGTEREQNMFQTERFFSLADEPETDETFGALVFHSQIQQTLFLADDLYERGEFDGVVDLCLSQLRQARDEYLGRSGDSVNLSLLQFYALAFVLAMSPITPHFSEFVYSKVFRLEGTVRKVAWPQVGRPDHRLLRANVFVGKMIKMIRNKLTQKAEKDEEKKEKEKEKAEPAITPQIQLEPITASPTKQPDAPSKPASPEPTHHDHHHHYHHPQFYQLSFDLSQPSDTQSVPPLQIPSQAAGIETSGIVSDAATPSSSHSLLHPPHSDTPTFTHTRFHPTTTPPNSVVIFVSNGYTDKQLQLIRRMESLWDEGQGDIDAKMVEHVKSMYQLPDDSKRLLGEKMKFVQRIKASVMSDGVTAFNSTYPFVESSVLLVNAEFIVQSLHDTSIQNVFVISKHSKFPKFLEQIPELSAERRMGVEPEDPLFVLFSLPAPIQQSKDETPAEKMERELRKMVLDELKEAEDTCLSGSAEKGPSPTHTPIPS